MNTIQQLAANSNYSYSTGAADLATSGIILLLLPIYLILGIFGIICLWKVFTKAGRPGWVAIIPFYNVWVLLEIAGKPGWWLLAALAISFIPIVGSIVVFIGSLLVSIELAKKFGKSTVFGVAGLWLFSLIGYAILAFSSAQYENYEQASAVTDKQDTVEATPTTDSTTPPSNQI
jgi:Family of unknown function (DUF5684)